MKKFIAIILSVAVLLMAGCSSVQEPVTTVPFDPQTITVGDVAGTIEGDRYISHVGGVAYKLTGKYTAEWPESEERSILMCDYTDIDVDGPYFVWEKPLWGISVFATMAMPFENGWASEYLYSITNTP